MTDAVVLAEVRVGRDHLVQPGHPYRDAVDDRFVARSSTLPELGLCFLTVGCLFLGIPRRHGLNLLHHLDDGGRLLVWWVSVLAEQALDAGPQLGLDVLAHRPVRVSRRMVATRSRAMWASTSSPMTSTAASFCATTTCGRTGPGVLPGPGLALNVAMP